MDVTCDRCNTEYEFEEALVSPRGTTVKCTQCGHLFKVFRSETPNGGALPGTHWTVRCVDGSARELAALAELTDLIGRGLVTRDDEVSRTGKAWRRLGDIEELEPYFTEADRRGPSREVTERTFPGLPDVAALPLDGDPAPTPAPNAPTKTPTQIDGAPQQQPAASAAPEHSDPDDDALTEQRVLPPRAAPAAEPVPPGAASLARESTPARKPARASRPPLAAANRSAPVPSAIAVESLANERDFERSPRQGHRPWPLLLSTATVIGLASFWFFSSPPTAAPRAPVAEAPIADPAQRYLERADALFATHQPGKFEEALDEYLKALGYHEQDAHILSSIARVHAVWAQDLRFRQEDERAPPESDVARRSEWLALGKQADARAQQALRYAETAARKNPMSREAQVALSDALRLTKDLRGAREELRRARAAEHAPDAETLRVAALLEIAEAKGDARAGRALAMQAVAAAPELPRVKLLLARCLVADGEVDAARQLQRELLARDAGLPAALALTTLFTRPSEPVAEPAPKPSEAEAPASAAASSSPHGENLSHEGYITRGQTALEAGAVNIAKRAFEQALFMRPSSAPAHTGLGYVALEKGRSQLAIEHFQAAARGGNDDAYIGLGEAYRRLGRNRDALRAYQNYLTRSPNGGQLSIARAQVERLGEELAKRGKNP